MRFRRRLIQICVTWLASIGLAATAGAISLSDFNVADLDNQSILVSGSGQLQFTNFQFYLGGADPGDFTISVLGDGIRLTGPTSVADGAAAEFYFSYEVSVLGAGLSIVGVALSTPSEITGDGFPTFVKSAKSVYSGPTPPFYHQDTLAGLTTRNFDGEFSDFASTSFAPQQRISVLDGVRLSAAGPGDTATLESIANTYTVVPEPASLALLALGILGLGLADRRR